MKNDTINRKRPWLRYGLVAMVVALVVAPVAVYAADSFDDVPDTNIFHDDIQWMADNGITAGCGGMNFCPSANVTREQMSAFMKRLATLQVVDAATAMTATDSETLAGAAPSAYQTVIAGGACNFTTCDDIAAAFDIVAIATATIDVPADGVASVGYGWTGSISGPTDDVVQTWIAIDQTTNSGCGSWFFAPGEAATGSFAQVVMDGGVDFLNTGASTAVTMSEGSHTVNLCVLGAEPTGNEQGSVSVVWSATGTGLSPAGAISSAALDAVKAKFETDVPDLRD